MYRYEEGDAVRVLFDIVSDGTVHRKRRGELIMPMGRTGYIQKRGILLDDLVYEVHFLEEGQVVGCREHELLLAEENWEPPLFQKKDRIRTTTDLHRKGELVLQKGEEGVVLTLDYHEDLGYIYEVQFSGNHRLMMAGSQLEKIEST